MDLKVAITAFFCLALTTSEFSISIEKFVRAPIAKSNYVPFITATRDNIHSVIECCLMCKAQSGCDGCKFSLSSKTCYLVDFSGVSNGDISAADGLDNSGLLITGQWTEWSSWSTCDEATLTNTRNRTCMAPFIGDLHCSNGGETSSTETRTCVLHLLVVHFDGFVEDFSLDPIQSPAVTTYPATFPNIGPYSGFLMTSDRQLYMLETQGQTRIYKWGFDSQLPALQSGAMPVHGEYPAVTSTSQAIYLFGGTPSMNLTDEYVVGSSGPTSITGGIPTRLGCAAAVPGDDAVIYISGGDKWTGGRTNLVWTFNTITRAFAERTFIPTASNTSIATHSCAGVIASNGQKAYVVLGGSLGDSSQIDRTADVYMYYIDLNQWTRLASLPQLCHHSTSIYHGGYIYLSGDNFYKEPYAVVRIKPDPALTTWETLGYLTKGTPLQPILQPYYP